MNNDIEIKGAKVNNLKNIDIKLPRDKFIVITGVSGSGKSSLAFDTLYAEGQRRYVESLSSYARQFLGRMNKPECDYIKGLPPAIAIEQKVTTRNPRSTVGTSTEIYEYLRLLYSRIGHTFSPISGTEVKKHTPDDILNCVKSFASGTKFVLLTPLKIPEGRTLEEQLKASVIKGFSRVFVNGDFYRIDDVIENINQYKSTSIKNSITLLRRLRATKAHWAVCLPLATSRLRGRGWPRFLTPQPRIINN